MHFFLIYIDPGIGSLAAQVIIAGFAAFMMFFKNTFKGLFFGSKKKEEDPSSEKKD